MAEKICAVPRLRPAERVGRDAIRTDVTKRLAAIVVESPDPVGLGQALGAHPGNAIRCRWRRRPHRSRHDRDPIRARRRPREILRTLVIEVADRSGIEARAVERGYPVSDASVEFCGVRFQLMR